MGCTNRLGARWHQEIDVPWFIRGAVTAALDKLWTAANFDDSDAIIDQKEYLTMHCSQ